METYSMYNFNLVTYFNQSDTIIHEKPIIRSQQVNNELLVMTDCKFLDNKLVTNKLMKDLSFDPEVLDTLLSTSLIQSDCEDVSGFDGNNFEFITRIEQSDIISLRVPKNCTKIILSNTDDDSIKTTIDFTSGQYMISDPEKVEKLVIIMISQYQTDNVSVIVHEFSDNPHTFISDKILTENDYYNAINGKEFSEDGEVRHLKSGVKLGDSLSESTPPKVFSVTEVNGDKYLSTENPTHSLNIPYWSPNTEYVTNDIVRFKDKIYVSTSNNQGIIPIPLISEVISEISIDNSLLLNSMATQIFGDSTNHINSNNQWRVLQ